MNRDRKEYLSYRFTGINNETLRQVLNDHQGKPMDEYLQDVRDELNRRYDILAQLLPESKIVGESEKHV